MRMAARWTARSVLGLAIGGALLLASACNARAEAAEAAPVTYSVSLIGDGFALVSGDAPDRGYQLGLADASVDADLATLLGWRGGRARLRAQASTGGEPNAAAATLRGIDNIEVSRQRSRLYEAWIDQSFGETVSVRAGLYDLNSEFYATASSGLLLAPPYGIGSELAATGVSGPSIYPSTAPAVRVRVGRGPAYFQAALVGADARSLGDPGGIDTKFRAGGLMIAQVGRADADNSLAFGFWRYTRSNDDLVAVDALGDPIQRRSQGVYGLVEKAVGRATYFVRAGASDGRTTPFRASWQAGALISPLFAARPDGQFSVGLGQEILGAAYRAAEKAAGSSVAQAETAVEFTYADRLADRLTVQPSLQIVANPGGRADRDILTVLALRVRLDF